MVLGVGVDGYICKMLVNVLGEDKVGILVDWILIGGNIIGLDILCWMDFCFVVDIICFEYL